MRHLGTFEQLVLFSVLELGEGAYGLSIRQNIEDRTGRTPSAGAIYTTLGRLEDRGFVTSRIQSRQTGEPGRPRKLYRLRPEGARALKDAYSTIQAMAGGLIPRLTELAEG